MEDGDNRRSTGLLEKMVTNWGGNMQLIQDREVGWLVKLAQNGTLSYTAGDGKAVIDAVSRLFWFVSWLLAGCFWFEWSVGHLLLP